MSELRKVALELYKPPFTYERGYIFDANNRMVADDNAESFALRVRGWGRISYEENPEKLQDMAGKLFAEALTLYWEALSTEHDHFSEVANIIHYPECWDTMAYPTIADALYELLTCSEHECSTCADAMLAMVE